MPRKPKDYTAKHPPLNHIPAAKVAKPFNPETHKRVWDAARRCFVEKPITHKP